MTGETVGAPESSYFWCRDEECVSGHYHLCTHRPSKHYDPSQGILPGDCWDCGMPLEATAARAEGIDWREKCQVLRSGLNEVLRLSPDCEGADYARRTLAETSDVG